MMERSRPADGKQIEDLVATIEGLLLPRGFKVKKNTRVHNDNGVQVAEFDVEIRGKLGSTKVAWLIECRNRPTEGPAPGAWIEQLVGRRSRFNFDKVTAVSATGFAQGAIAYAKTVGIDLREIDEIAPEVADWCLARSLHSQELRHWLTNAQLQLKADETSERLQAVKDAIGNKQLNAPQLRSTQTGVTISVLDAFMNAVGENQDVWAGIEPNHEPKPVHLSVEYPLDESHFVVDTGRGPVRIAHINFDGRLAIVENDVPLSQVSEYRQVGCEQPVSQSVGFTVPVSGANISVDFHRLIETGETHIALRPVDETTTATPNVTQAPSEQ